MAAMIDLRLRFTGHPPLESIHKVSFDPNSTIDDLRRYLNEAYFFANHYIMCQFIFSGSVLPPQQTIASIIKAGFSPKKDVLTIMTTGERFLLRKEPKFGPPPYSDSQFEFLRHELEKGVTPLREEAAKLLGTSGNPRRAVPLLIKVLKDPYCLLRELAAESLGTLGDPAAVETLVQTLEDPNPDVVQAVTRALTTLGYTKK
jgi:hypothetical protein